ncbi:site-specific integrase [Hamadaea sp. NPDC050747]|uniref:site-specific integrase n=1 Tax=Hamadaea sp. NPDC050747 TaxID=3155789 RepID=UPI0033D6854F
MSQRGDDKWLAQLPPSMGRRGKIKPSEEEAWQWLREEHARATLGIREPEEHGSSALLRDLVWVWYEGASLAETTASDWKYRIKAEMLPAPIMDKAAKDAKPMDIDQALQLTPENWTRIHTANLWRRFCEWLEANDFTTRNLYARSDAKRILAVQRAKLEPKEAVENTWTPEEFAAFLAHEGDPVMRDYWVTAAATAGRRGEVIGMRWPLVDTEGGWCWLEDNVTTADGREVRRDSPKGYRRRKAYFGRFIGLVLEKRRQEQEAYRQIVGDWDPSEWVFDRRKTRFTRAPGFRHGMHLSPSTVTSRFSRHARELGLPPLAGPHGLRRTWNTLAEEDGIRFSVRRDFMGHSKKRDPRGGTSVTSLYGKSNDRELLSAADRIVQLLLPESMREELLAI